MKKLILIATVFLVIAGIISISLTSVAGAKQVEVIKKNSLIGTSKQGLIAVPPSAPVFKWSSTTNFRITNPNDSDDITLNRLSVYDESGGIIYQGPVVKLVELGNPTRMIVATLAPHETISIGLSHLIWTGAGAGYNDVTDIANWKTFVDAMDDPPQYYSIEIVWDAQGSAKPLTGWQQNREEESSYEDGDIERQNISWSESLMVNLK